MNLVCVQFISELENCVLVQRYLDGMIRIQQVKFKLKRKLEQD